MDRLIPAAACSLRRGLVARLAAPVREYRFWQTDVFTDRVFAGNPLAVFPEAEGLSDAEMQRIAAEMNLSETAFVLPPTDVQALCRLRIFTPKSELPLAGHPVVGTFFTLAQRGELGLGDRLRRLSEGALRIHQECGAGVLPVDIRVRNGEVRQVVMTQARPRFFGECADRAALAACLGLGQDEVVPEGSPPAQVVSTALPQLMVPVRSLRSVERLELDPVAARALLNREEIGSDCMMVFSTRCVNDGSTAHARMFAPALGVAEDPATGSAAGALGAWLVRYGLAGARRPDPVRLVIEQGFEMGRPSLIQVEVEREMGRPSLVRVGGQAVEVAEGVLRIPS